jgi:hypothetical protein
MGSFLASEKAHQVAFKATSPTISAAARAEGIYRHEARPFCLPMEHAEENLYPTIRGSALDYFASLGIQWHQGQDGKPSNHLCSSQVCCLNFLWPFADQPDALATVLRPLFPTLDAMLPIERGHYVTFEWIGTQNYLGEVCRNGKRTRGANYTSADAAVMFQRNDGRRQIVLIEWKYTESYGRTALRVARSGTDRLAIYRPLLEHDDCPIDQSQLPAWDALFYEPFYQLMRQQLLAHEMERAHELGADIVTLLHIAPEHNLAFRRVTSPALVELGQSATDVWAALTRSSGRFLSTSQEQLFGRLTAEQVPEMQGWLDYMHARYPSVLRSAPFPASYQARTVSAGIIGAGGAWCATIGRH